MKKLIIGIIVSIVFIYFSIQGVEYKQIIRGLENVNYQFLFPTIMLFLSISFLRSIRWGVIVSPIDKIGQRIIFPITCIGFMAIALVPLRLGELLRPYLLSRKSKISLSPALGTVFVERVLDSLTLLFILLIVILSSNLPGWLIKAGYSFLVTFIIMVFVMFLLYWKTQFVLNLFDVILNKLPQRLKIKTEKLILTFVDGFKIISSPKRLAYTIFLSLLIWILSALAIYNLYFFQNLKLPLLSSFVVLVLTIVGITLPAAPGFLGNFQFSCIMALSIFDVTKSDALVFSMVFYFLGIGINILLGLIFLPFIGISINDLRKNSIR